MDQTFERRKKLIYDFICDEFYVPMKLKELAILLQVPKDQRKELKAIMDSLEAEGKVQKREVYQGRGKAYRRDLSGSCERIWLCCGRRGRR